jgi:hypothetical protein
MQLSRSKVATLAVLGATCALPAVAASQAAAAAPKPGTYVDAKHAVDVRVAKDRRTLTFVDGFCVANHVQTGTWKASKLRLAHNAFKYDGRLRVLLLSPKGASKVLMFTIHGSWTGARFNGSYSTSNPALCAARKFSAKFAAPLPTR